MSSDNPLLLPSRTFTVCLAAASYSAETGRYNCTICKTKNMSRASFEVHRDTQKHKDREKVGSKQVNKKLRRYQRFLCAPLVHKLTRLKAVRDLKQKQATEAGLYRYLLEAPASSRMDEDDNEARRTELEPALKMLDQYEYKDRLVVLALAVWKAQCLENLSMSAIDGTGGLSAVQEYLKQWVQSGWKAHKAEHCKSNAIDIVVQAVLPFLPPADA